MPIVAELYDHVVGVDTHAATHHYAIVAAATGAVLDQARFPTSPAGLKRAAAWLARRTGGNLDSTSNTLVSIEGTGMYGARLAVLLGELGYRVVDAPSPKRVRGKGKNDTIDAVLAARGALGKDTTELAEARAGQLRAATQLLVTGRDAMTRERTRAINALTALVRVHDLGIDARRKLSRPTIRTIAKWRTRHEPPLAQIARSEAVRIATRILDLDHDIDANLAQLRQLVSAQVPLLLDLPGIGPVNAAIIITAWSHPGRVRNDAAFAKLGGVCPLEVSSGNNEEHRLNRTGDRQLNRALHTIANNRMTHHPETREYLQRRTTQGLSKARIRRCLKRYIARQIHRTLTNHHAQPAAA